MSSLSFDPEVFHVETYRNSLLCSELRRLGGSTEQASWSDGDANSASAGRYGNSFRHDRHSAGEYDRSADADHNEGCRSGHDADCSGHSYTSGTGTTNNTGTH